MFKLKIKKPVYQSKKISLKCQKIIKAFYCISYWGGMICRQFFVEARARGGGGVGVGEGG